MKGNRPRGGMTVIELVVVVTLIGIMASVVTPSLFAVARPSAAETAVDRVDALVRFGQTAAIERAQRVELTIDPATGRFWFDSPDSIGAIDLPAGSALVSRAKRVHVHFEPDGEALMDEPLFVREGETTQSIVVDR